MRATSRAPLDMTVRRHPKRTMHIRTCVVDNRILLLGLDELYRTRMKQHERGELLRCARLLCEKLDLRPDNGPAEGYYSEDDQLTEYFQRMRALQRVEDSSRAAVAALPEFRRLYEVTSAPLFGEPTSVRSLLPSGKDPLAKALEATFPGWTIDALTAAAYQEVTSSSDFSLVGLAVLAREPVVIAALRETAVLYAGAVAGAALEPVTFVYEWAVEPVIAERATRFVAVFNALFSEDLPVPGPDNAAEYWNAADEARVYGRCVRLGYDDSADPTRHYHWAVLARADSLVVRDFWSTQLWTTERFREALWNPDQLPFRAPD